MRPSGDSGSAGTAACALACGSRSTARTWTSSRTIFDLLETEDMTRCCVYHLAYAGRGDQIRSYDLTPAETRAAVEYIFDRVQDFDRRGHRQGDPDRRQPRRQRPAVQARAARRAGARRRRVPDAGVERRQSVGHRHRLRRPAGQRPRRTSSPGTTRWGTSASGPSARSGADVRRAADGDPEGPEGPPARAAAAAASGWGSATATCECGPSDTSKISWRRTRPAT